MFRSILIRFRLPLTYNYKIIILWLEDIRMLNDLGSLTNDNRFLGHTNALKNKTKKKKHAQSDSMTCVIAVLPWYNKYWCTLSFWLGFWLCETINVSYTLVRNKTSYLVVMLSRVCMFICVRSPTGYRASQLPEHPFKIIQVAPGLSKPEGQPFQRQLQ